MMLNRTGIVHFGILTVGILLGTYGFGSRNARSKEISNAFVLIVNIRLKPGTVPRFFELWHPLANYVRANEPNTLAYEACISTDDENVIMIYERYRTRDDLHVVHKSSEAYKIFSEKLKEADIVADKSGQSYFESDIGYM
eukprot:TRINITY_DN2905_c0_g1::TRINITY_DN2905_c0_g1_i1::g.4221::m.4221 TRINITY_DN2905_c0_g1::TRINITY_DN2905_c0_g1_i1::g.4221  ORF type:complete len:154 (+),score=16.08,ABM/PF03992.11/3.8e-09 TRINITY_DN2905_c0_g1_i1:45-464(+)